MDVHVLYALAVLLTLVAFVAGAVFGPKVKAAETAVEHRLLHADESALSDLHKLYNDGLIQKSHVVDFVEGWIKSLHADAEKAKASVATDVTTVAADAAVDVKKTV